MTLLSPISIILVFALILRGGATEHYCSEDNRLVTEFVTSTFEETRPVQGCVSTERHSQNGYQVVVIRANTTSESILLKLKDISAAGVMIVLDSPLAITWRLNFLGGDKNNHIKPLVVHAAGSSVVTENNMEIKLLKSDYKTMRLSPKMSDEKFGTIIRQKYGGLTIMAQVIGANRVALSLSKKPADRVPSQCNLNNLEAISDFIVGYNVRKQPMYGCFHPEKLGTMSTDVHIIDLQVSDMFNSAAATESVLPTNVIFSMAPSSPHSHELEVGESRQSRNLTVILKSDRPVRWYLESWKMSGSLRVISNNGHVENHALSEGQHLKIERSALPDDFQDLWPKVIGETGAAPVSYIKVKDANVISMSLPSQIRQSSHILNTAEHKLKFNSNYVPDRASLHDSPVSGSHDVAVNTVPKRVSSGVTRISHKVKQLEQDLEELVHKKCEQSDTIITLPIEALMKFNVTSLSLNEPSCMGVKNETLGVWVLKTLSTSCGSLNDFKGINPIMQNEIHLQFAPYSEFYGEDVRIPFTCKYPPGVGDFAAVESDFDDDDDDLAEEGEEENKEMYTMKILRKRKRPSQPELLVSHPNEHATVLLGDRLKVQTDLASKSFLSLTVEQCWVSDNPSADRRFIEDYQWLISDACPSNANVTMFPTKMGANPAFAFEVTEAHRRMGQIYLFCIIGLCSPIKSLTTGNLGLCVEDPTAKCSSDDWHIDSAALQLSRRGPLYVTDRRLNVEIDTANVSGLKLTELDPDQNSLESPVLHSAHVVMVGVPAEIAVAISIASFLIGAALTGMLCCIHHRKALPKSARNTGTDNREGGSELHPMLSPQSPSITLAQPQQQQQQPQPSGVKLDVNA